MIMPKVLKRLLGASLSLGVMCGACNGPSDVPLPTRLDHLQAFYCSTPGQAKCTERGAPIPQGTLPPVGEAFEVWAFYRGWFDTHWRVEYGFGDSTVIDKFTPDSANVWLNLNGGGAPTYTIHVFVKGPSGMVAHDSLLWNFAAAH
jgi:hypothetical protein